MADSKTIAPEVRACGDVLATVATEFATIERMVHLAVDSGGDDATDVMLGVAALARRCGLIADRAAALAGAGRVKSDLEWLAAPRDMAALRALGDQQAAQVAVD